MSLGLKSKNVLKKLKIFLDNVQRNRLAGISEKFVARLENLWAERTSGSCLEDFI